MFLSKERTFLLWIQPQSIKASSKKPWISVSNLDQFLKRFFDGFTFRTFGGILKWFSREKSGASIFEEIFRWIYLPDFWSNFEAIFYEKKSGASIFLMDWAETRTWSLKLLKKCPDLAEDLTNALTGQTSGNKYCQKCGKILTAWKITHNEV